MTEAHTTKNNGGYDLDGVIWHQHSNRLMEEIMKIFQKEVKVIDIGCGHNFYVSVLNYAGYDAIGVDVIDLGHKAFKQIDITENDCFVMEGNRNVISLEVGEHIPEEFSKNYLDTIASQGGNILMSWAVPGQAGHGHINCRDNSWVIDHMHKRGYKMDFPITHQLRNAVKSCHCSWFRNTLMYFVPK